MDQTLSQVVAALSSSDNRWDPIDILDALYLASRLPSTNATESVKGFGPGSAPTAKPAAKRPPAPRPVVDDTNRGDQLDRDGGQGTRKSKDYQADLPYRGAYAGDSAKAADGLTVIGRGGAPLANPRDYLRALRPLKQVKASRSRFVLDEDATAEVSAIHRLLMPQLRPSDERWLKLDVVIDTSRSMAVWHATLRQFKLLLLKAGIFQRVTFWSWDTEGRPDESVIGCDWPARGKMDRKPTALCTADARQLVLVLSDAIADGWRDGRASAAIQQWSRHALVALIPTLPSRFWKRTGLAAADPALILPCGSASNGFDLYCVPRRRSQLRARTGRGPSQKLTIEQWRKRRPVIAVSAIQPLAFSRLTNFVSRLGTDPMAGICLSDSSTASSTIERLESETLDPSAEELLQAFDAHASPEARLLARYLSVLGYFSLEMIRLIRQTMIPQAVLHDEAEILFSGIAKILQDKPDPEKVIYGFLGPVRRKLAGDITVQKTFQIVQKVFSSWSKAAGIDANSLELLLRQSSSDESSASDDGDPLATIAAETIQALMPIEAGLDTIADSKAEGIRSPRVHLTYDVELGDAMMKRELPAVIGVLADLSGDKSPKKPVADRKFVHVDRDNFDSVLKVLAPQLFLEVENVLANSESPGMMWKVQLKFESFEDFSPVNVVKQFEPTLRYLTLRNGLLMLRNRVDVKDKLENALNLLLNETHSRTGALDPVVAAAKMVDISASSISKPQYIDDLIRAAYGDTAELYSLLKEAWEVVRPAPKQDIHAYLRSAVLYIDARLSRQVATILHHEKFQQLEGTWRGLHRLVFQLMDARSVRISVFNASRYELLEMVEGFENSPLYRQLVDESYGIAGGVPFSVLVGDYSFSTSDEDVELLSKIGQIAAEGATPFIASASPEYLGRPSFEELNAPRELRVASTPALEALRRSEAARFLVLTCPRVLARMPYGRNTRPVEEFDFEEADMETPGRTRPMDNHEYCWMSSAWTLVECIGGSFAKTSFYKTIQGQGGGRVSDLPIHVFKNADGDMATRGPTEVAIPDRRESELHSLGLSPLCAYHNTDYAVFFSPVTLAEDSSHRLHTSLSAMLMTCRFIHYLKVIARDRIGSFMEREDQERYLNNWIMNYVSNDDSATELAKTRYPLQDAKIQLFSVPGQPGTIRAELHIRPWLQYGQLDSPIRMSFTLPRNSLK